jgi:hypothetical protein
MNKSELEPDVTYLLCPDKDCKLFYDTSRIMPCESDCPGQDELVKIIQCHGCEELIELPGDHHMMRRVDHNCLDGNRASNFSRMSGRYQLIYEKPE